MLGAVLGMIGLVATLGGCTAESTSDGEVSTANQALEENKEGITVKWVSKDTNQELKVSPDAVNAYSCTTSFAGSCNGATLYVEPGTLQCWKATADACRRKNNTWTGFRQWGPGECGGDISNHDGNLICL